MFRFGASDLSRRRGLARILPSPGPAMDSQTIQTLIEQGLPGASAKVQGADGVHFEALVVAEAFAGKLPLARHRMVYATLGDLMGGAIPRAVAQDADAGRSRPTKVTSKRVFHGENCN